MTGDRPDLRLVGGPHATVNAYGLTPAQSRQLATFLRKVAYFGPDRLLEIAADLDQLADAGTD
jgi:hypothetical protein